MVVEVVVEVVVVVVIEVVVVVVDVYICKLYMYRVSTKKGSFSFGRP